MDFRPVQSERLYTVFKGLLEVQHQEPLLLACLTQFLPRRAQRSCDGNYSAFLNCTPELSGFAVESSFLQLLMNCDQFCAHPWVSSV